jgi:hypothetical protein
MSNQGMGSPDLLTGHQQNKLQLLSRKLKTVLLEAPNSEIRKTPKKQKRKWKTKK